MGLGDVDGFEIGPVAAIGFDCCGMVVVGWGFIDWSSHGRNVDVDDFFGVAVEDWGEVEREGILAVVDVGSVVHQGLLQSDLVAEALVEADRPCFQISATALCRALSLTIAVHFMHVLFRDATNHTLFNHLRIPSADMLNLLQLRHCNLNLRQPSFLPM